MNEKLISLIVGLVCITPLIVILIRLLVCPERVFMTKKQYEKEKLEEKERYKQLQIDYPTIVSRLSAFFDMPEEKIIEEIRNICKDELR